MADRPFPHLDLNERSLPLVVKVVKDAIDAEFVKSALLHFRNVEGSNSDSQLGDSIDSFCLHQNSDRLDLLSSSYLDHVKLSITKLYDAQRNFLGSAIHLTENIVITAFHVVLHQGEILQGDDLLLPDGIQLLHLASYPFYDLSIFQAGNGNVPPLTYSRERVRIGMNVHMASFSAVDKERSEVKDEKLLIVPGNVSRIQTSSDSPFFAASYLSGRASSGGAIVDRKGLLVGMHVNNLYTNNESNVQYRMKSGYTEDCTIIHPNRRVKVRHGSCSNIDQHPVDKPVFHALPNIGEKLTFSCFLPISVIKVKVQACLIRLHESSHDSDSELE